MKLRKSNLRPEILHAFLLMLFLCCSESAYCQEVEPPVDAQSQFIRGSELIQAGDSAKGVDWMRRAGTNGLLRAQITLVELLRANGDESSRSESLWWAVQAGRKSDSMSKKYLLGELRPGDPAEYFRAGWPWLERLARELDPALRYEAGRWAYNGYGQPKDFALAFKYFTEASRDETFGRKNPQLYYLLGYLNENGFGTAQNYALAAALYWQAAENGWPDAVYRLGLLLEHGQGVAKNAPGARLLFVRAAELGVAAAAYRKGLLTDANGVAKDDRKEAFNWYLQAATNGNSMAQIKVALSYEQARLNHGADLVEALAWYRIAALGGNRGGRIKAENLERALSATDRSRSEAWFAVVQSMIHESIPKVRPGENLLPEGLASKRNDILSATESSVRNRPRTLSEARLQNEEETSPSPSTRRNDLEAGMVNIYMNDLQERVRMMVNNRLAESAKRADFAGTPIPEEMEIILSYRLLSDGRVEDVAVVDTNLAERIANIFVFAVEDSSPTPSWTPRLRAELTEEYQDLLLAFGKKSILRISQ